MSNDSTRRDWIGGRPIVDFGAAAIFGIGYLIAHLAEIDHPTIDHPTAVGIYQTMGTVGAGLLGIVFAAVAIIRTLDPGRRLQKLREVHGPAVTKSMMAAIRGLGIATLLFFLDLGLDEPGGLPALARTLAVFGFVLAVARIIRLTWVFGLLLAIDDADYRAAVRSSATPPLLELRPERRRKG